MRTASMRSSSAFWSSGNCSASRGSSASAVLDLAKRIQRNGAVAGHRLRLLRGGDLDLRAQRPALVDRNRHADGRRGQPRVQAQQRQHDVADAPAGERQREARQQRQFGGFLVAKGCDHLALGGEQVGPAFEQGRRHARAAQRARPDTPAPRQSPQRGNAPAAPPGRGAPRHRPGARLRPLWACSSLARISTTSRSESLPARRRSCTSLSNSP